MRKLILLVLLFAVIKGYSQSALNDYKYIIVPKKFSCFKTENQYKTSTLIKYLFSQNGFIPVYEDALPMELNKDRCLGLTVDVVNKSNMFTTKTALALNDCYSKQIVISEMGVSKVKEYRGAFDEAIREAFVSIKEMNYSYSPTAENNETVTANYKNDIKQVVQQKEMDSKNRIDQNVVKQEASQEKQLYDSKEPVKSAVIVTSTPEVTEQSTKTAEASGAILYAQETPNGYQLVDSSPKIQMRIFKTSISDNYIAKSEDKNGIVYQKDGKWYFDYYDGDQLISEELNIKF